jgi:hypothetical protein
LFEIFFSKLKIKTKTRRSQVDLKNILIEDFLTLSLKDLNQRSTKDLKKILSEDLSNLLLDLVKIFTKDLRENSFFRRSQKKFGSWV